MSEADALVIGGGLAGSMVALELARGARQVLLLEKTKSAHHKVCGEFLSGETLHYLHRHGIDLQAMGAVALQSVRLVMRGGIVEQPLPFPAFSLTRCVLDEALLQRAAAAGVEVRRGRTVEALEHRDASWCVDLRGGDRAHSQHVFLATGKHDVRGWPRAAGTHRGLVAFKMYYRLAPQQLAALGGAVELMLFPGGYAGLQQVEGGRVNLCLLMTASCLKRVGGNWAQVESYLQEQVAHLQTRLGGATALLEAPLAVSHIPYGHMQHSAPRGLWHLGDQAAVIPSFCGDGMAIALHSGAWAARHFLRGESPEIYRRQLHAHMRLRLSFATRLSQAMVALPGAVEIVRLVPGLLSGIARITRIPDAALVRDMA